MKSINIEIPKDIPITIKNQGKLRKELDFFTWLIL